MGINQSAFNKLLARYDKIRQDNNNLLKKRREEVFAKIPKLQDVHNKVATLGLTTAQAVMEDPSRREDYLEGLTEHIAMLVEHKQRLLVANGYPPDYLDPIYNCKLCKDTGYVGNERCRCLKQAIIHVAYEQSNLKAILEEENFDTFSLDYYDTQVLPEIGVSPRSNMLSVLDRCLEFVENFSHTFANLILYGQSGLGKTFLCNAIAKALLDEGYTVIYLSAFQLFRIFENYRFHNDNQEYGYEEIQALYDCDLLIIDDLGTEVNNSFTSSELFNCLNTRLLHKKHTVVSTNLGSSEWSVQYSERIVSRIFGYYTPLKFFGTDIRLMKYR
ncbi:ATP-binding protein [Anaerotalea alkaliphila]|uniref:ATP-binding protein n=1 Tax=Anaerotalea alkaliphila TaxID=2662126 RepID=A0A7X5HUM8_9FIRM|nr:ATP-binding protein [Anaerotalea alkaliphila]NDL66731.1 ATP-binding protein [Anaerotalea alkaliphila]